MNVCMFTGNISRMNDIQVRGETQFVKFTLAVNRKTKGDTADFVGFTAFGKTAEFVTKYCKVGSKLAVVSHYQQGSYENKDGKKIYTHDFLVDSLEKTSRDTDGTPKQETKAQDDYGFVNVADGLNDDGLPFN